MKLPEGSLPAPVLRCLVSSVDTGAVCQENVPAATAGGARVLVPGVGVSRPNNEKYYTDLLSAAALPGHTRPHCTRQPLKHFSSRKIVHVCCRMEIILVSLNIGSATAQ